MANETREGKKHSQKTANIKVKRSSKRKALKGAEYKVYCLDLKRY